jgi:hypothetical protein
VPLPTDRQVSMMSSQNGSVVCAVAFSWMFPVSNTTAEPNFIWKFSSPGVVTMLLIPPDRRTRASCDRCA